MCELVAVVHTCALPIAGAAAVSSTVTLSSSRNQPRRDSRPSCSGTAACSLSSARRQPPRLSASGGMPHCGCAVCERLPPVSSIRRLLSPNRSEEHTSELQSLMRISYAVFCLKKQKKQQQ